MLEAMNTKLEVVEKYCLDLLSESSTWRSIVFVISMVTARYGFEIDESTAVAISTTLYIFFGIILKDKLLRKTNAQVEADVKNAIGVTNNV
jgi:hypothetical protein